MRSRARCLLVVVAACLAIACGGSPGSGGTRRLSIATGGTGGVFYPYGGGIAKVLTEQLPHTEVTAEVTAASVDNLKFIKQGTSDLAFSMADIAADAAAGRDAFKDFGSVPVRVLAVLYPSYTHLVTLAGSGINKVSDLRGKVVSTGAPGAGTTVLAERILTAAGLDPGTDIRAHNLGVSQSVDALKDGKVDAFFWNGGIPTAAILDLVNTQGITAKILPLDDVLPALQQRYGQMLYYRTIIPAATYKMPADVPVVAVANMLVVSESMPEPLAHDITKILFEQQPTLAGIHPQARDLSVEHALTGASIPFHPGAIRYYRERGVWKD
ncbi:MAG TPA: TAXI family TRAP transporter solute-binding subunit [Vicinamibacterales bacterium]|nr:TAXI family TRAP transporter solute-binding subunit [Vicinamibacterales bacterium]